MPAPWRTRSNRTPRSVQEFDALLGAARNRGSLDGVEANAAVTVAPRLAPLGGRDVKTSQLKCYLVGLWVLLHDPELGRGVKSTDERGLSQSAEMAILLAGAVLVAGTIVTAITMFVKSHLPK